MCFTRPNGLREKKEPKKGPLFFKKRCASAAQGAFYKPGRAGNGKHVNMESLVSSGTERQKTTQKPQRAPRDSQRPPEAPRGPQRPPEKLPKTPKGPQRPPRASQSFLWDLGNPAGHLETPRSPQRAQKLPDAPKSPHPEAPRGPRGSQEPQERPLEPPRPAPRPACHTRTPPKTS